MSGRGWRLFWTVNVLVGLTALAFGGLLLSDGQLAVGAVSVAAGEVGSVVSVAGLLGEGRR